MNKKENNIRPFASITEEDLNAYVDDQLDSWNRQKVEAYLKRHPEQQEKVNDYRRYNHLLRSVYANKTSSLYDKDIVPYPVPSRKARNDNFRTMAKVAAVMVLCGASAFGGWLSAHSGQEVTSISAPKGSIAHVAEPRPGAILVSTEERTASASADMVPLAESVQIEEAKNDVVEPHVLELKTETRENKITDGVILDEAMLHEKNPENEVSSH